MTDTLDLGQLYLETDLSPPVVEALALAASVTLERTRGKFPSHDACVAIISIPDTQLDIHPMAVDDAARASLGDHLEATEWGAAAIAVGVVHRVLGRRVFRRLPKGTGADYLMRVTHPSDTDTFERLEVSGIASGSETALVRLAEKVQQLGRRPRAGGGWALVTRFHGPDAVEIRGKQWCP